MQGLWLYLLRMNTSVVVVKMSLIFGEGGGPTRQRNKLETHFFTLAEALLAYHTVAYDRYGTQVAVLAPAGCLYDTILQFYELPVCTDYVL